MLFFFNYVSTRLANCWYFAQDFFLIACKIKYLLIHLQQVSLSESYSVEDFVIFNFYKNLYILAMD